MLSSALCWFLGALLLTVGVVASLYLAWLQLRRGVTTFSLLATSDSLATIAIAIAFLINAANHQESNARISMRPTECSHGQLTLASALFLAPFVNTFVSMMAHSADNMQDGPEARGHDATHNRKLLSSIAAQWLLPTASTLLLLSAGIQHSRPYRVESDNMCMEGTALTPIPVESTEQCVQHEGISQYITTLMNNHNLTTRQFVNRSQSTDRDVAKVVDNIYKILDIRRYRRATENKHQDSIYKKPKNVSTYLKYSDGKTNQNKNANFHNRRNKIVNEIYPKYSNGKTNHNKTGNLHNRRNIIANEIYPKYSNGKTNHNKTGNLHNRRNIIANEIYPKYSYGKTNQNKTGNLHNRRNIIANEIYPKYSNGKTNHNKTGNLHNRRNIIANEIYPKYSYGKTNQNKTGNLHNRRNIIAYEIYPKFSYGKTNHNKTATVKHSILSSVAMWTPTLVETLLRLWFCISTPQWLTTLLFMLAQIHAIIRNSLNVRLVRKQTCTGTIQPLSESEDTPSKLFTKVKAAILK
ncbi:hypothetical protein L9F63_012242 [Diploptera punctata]|uniref:Uncharacterized protein n=1 Tax=Diploptera punctata TaxID=6984 RepID=A0AAD8ACY5_DIPPU|nr:hypothetical protein L9F63_012242 [Diploptera punctata]